MSRAAVAGETTRVLEIGYGNKPACNEGWLFDNETVQYVGLELPREFPGSFRFSSVPPDMATITASMNAMPFADETYDYVLMRSVFGQFRSRPEIVRPVRLGIYECVRILKTNGHIIIAEENTPEESDYVRSELADAGFEEEATYIMPGQWEDVTEQDEWLVQRSKFYTGRPTQSGPSDNLGTPYLMVAYKPEGLTLENFTARVCINFYEPSNDRGGKRHFRELTFQRPKN